MLRKPLLGTLSAFLLVGVLVRSANPEPGNPLALLIMAKPSAVSGYRCGDWPRLAEAERRAFIVGAAAMHDVILNVAEDAIVKESASRSGKFEGTSLSHHAGVFDGYVYLVLRATLPFSPTKGVDHKYADLAYASESVSRVCRQLGSETSVMAALYLGK
jgi:hypothetical protein